MDSIKERFEKKFGYVEFNDTRADIPAFIKEELNRLAEQIENCPQITVIDQEIAATIIRTQADLL